MSATSRSASSRLRTHAAPLRSSTVRGAELDALLAQEIDDLALRCAASATSRGPWLTGTVAAARERQPCAVVVRDSDDLLRAAVVLLTTGNGDADLVTLAGAAMGYRSSVLADGPAPAALLGDALAEAVRAPQRAVRIELGPIDSTSPWIADFAEMIPGAEVVPCDSIPAVRRAGDADALTYLTASIRRTLRKAQNRTSADRRHLSAQVSRDQLAIGEMLPELERVHRERDHAQGRRSDLDDPEGRRMWTARLTRLAAEGLLEMSTLHVDGELAAYVIALVDPPAYRVLEGNLATAWSRYAPGRLLETAILKRMLDDPAFDYLDWMTAVASDRLLAANETQPVCFVRVEYLGAARN